LSSNGETPRPLVQRLGERWERRCPRRDGRAAEQCDERASYYLIELYSVPVSEGQIVGYRIGADQSAGIAGVLQILLAMMRRK
jgi:hypothetical protein